MKTERHKKAAVRRKLHVRRKVSGTPERPRLSVFRSNRHMYAQIIDDTAGVTLVTTSTQCKELREQVEAGGGPEGRCVCGRSPGEKGP